MEYTPRGPGGGTSITFNLPANTSAQLKRIISKTLRDIATALENSADSESNFTL